MVRPAGGRQSHGDGNGGRSRNAALAVGDGILERVGAGVARHRGVGDRTGRGVDRVVPCAAAVLTTTDPGLIVPTGSLSLAQHADRHRLVLPPWRRCQNCVRRRVDRDGDGGRWNAVTLSVNLLDIDHVTRFQKQLHRVTNVPAAGIGQKSFNILHDKPFWPNAFEQPDVMAQQKIPCVITGFHPRAAESLTRRPAQQDVQFAALKTTTLQYRFRVECADVQLFHKESRQNCGDTIPPGRRQYPPHNKCRSPPVETRGNSRRRPRKG